MPEVREDELWKTVIDSNGVECLEGQLDLTVTADVLKFLQWAEQRYGHMNNAKIPPPVIGQIAAKIAALEESASSYRSALELAEKQCRAWGYTKCQLCKRESGRKTRSSSRSECTPHGPISHAPNCPFSRLKETK